MRLLPIGPSAVLVEEPPGGPASWSLDLRSLGLSGITDIVPAARTVLIRCDSAATLAATTLRFSDVTGMSASVVRHRDTVMVPVRYDGADLEKVARTIGVTTDEVIALHSGVTYDVAFCGFAPGFGYLRGLPDKLHLPRRATPRTRVPAGSVAIASEYSAVYPNVSPGGWHLLGSTDVVLFDPLREPPALLGPGVLVEFEPA